MPTCELPAVTTCCFCIPLRITTIFIGYIGAIFSCICVLVSAFSFGCLLVQDTMGPSVFNEDLPRSQYVVLYMVIMIMVIEYTISFILCVVLIVGGQGYRPNLFRVYYTYGSVVVICNAVFAITLLFIKETVLGNITTLTIAFQIIYIIIVRCAYVHMVNEDTEGEFTVNTEAKFHTISEKVHKQSLTTQPNRGNVIQSLTTQPNHGNIKSLE